MHSDSSSDPDRRKLTHCMLVPTKAVPTAMMVPAARGEKNMTNNDRIVENKS